MRVCSTTPTFSKIAFGVILMPQESHFSLIITHLHMNNSYLSLSDVSYLQALHSKKSLRLILCLCFSDVG